MTEFVCANPQCGLDVEAHAWRNHNHCPHCFWSVHLMSYDDHGKVVITECNGLMEPVLIAPGVRVEHKCIDCGFMAGAGDWPNEVGVI